MNSKRILPIIIFSQFCCTSLWFASNGIMGDLAATFELPNHALGHLTAAVQFGFIMGTLVFAFLTIADRFSPSQVFFVCAVLGAAFNLGMLLESNGMISLLLLRFLTGFSLAGIYPIGMKIAADYYEKGLGRSLGFLVGALVLGTAFPHALNEFSGVLPWKTIVWVTSGLAATGGILLRSLVPNGPYRRKSDQLDFSALSIIFKVKDFKTAAFGYFGHMWELYAFWAFIPFMIATHNKLFPGTELSVSFYTFVIIGIGCVSCILAGYIAERLGTKRTATLALSLSGICCLISPIIFYSESQVFFIVFLIFWGMVVIADSPMFSTLVAQHTTPKLKGTALTIVNCIGFSITIISIQLLTFASEWMPAPYLFLCLAVGPIFGLTALFQKK